MTEKYITPTQLMNSWRIGNIIILLLTSFLPWTVSWSDVASYSVGYTNGWDYLFLPKSLIGMKPFIEEISPDVFLPLLRFGLINALVPITTIGYSLYCVIVFLSDIRRTTRYTILTLFILLIAGYPVWHISYGIGFNNKLSWGYYLFIFGFISSILLEGYSIFWLRVRQTKSEFLEPS